MITLLTAASLGAAFAAEPGSEAGRRIAMRVKGSILSNDWTWLTEVDADTLKLVLIKLLAWTAASTTVDQVIVSVNVLSSAHKAASGLPGAWVDRDPSGWWVDKPMDHRPRLAVPPEALEMWIPKFSVARPLFWDETWVVIREHDEATDYGMKAGKISHAELASRLWDRAIVNKIMGTRYGYNTWMILPSKLFGELVGPRGVYIYHRDISDEAIERMILHSIDAFAPNIRRRGHRTWSRKLARTLTREWAPIIRAEYEVWDKLWARVAKNEYDLVEPSPDLAPFIEDLARSCTRTSSRRDLFLLARLDRVAIGDASAIRDDTWRASTPGVDVEGRL